MISNKCSVYGVFEGLSKFSQGSFGTSVGLSLLYRQNERGNKHEAEVREHRGWEDLLDKSWARQGVYGGQVCGDSAGVADGAVRYRRCCNGFRDGFSGDIGCDQGGGLCGFYQVDAMCECGYGVHKDDGDDVLGGIMASYSAAVDAEGLSYAGQSDKGGIMNAKDVKIGEWYEMSIWDDEPPMVLKCIDEEDGYWILEFPNPDDGIWMLLQGDYETGNMKQSTGIALIANERDV